MKHIKTYEKFGDLFKGYYEKLPEVKIAMAFVKFLNDINSELECYYKRNNDGVWVIDKNNNHLMLFNPAPYSVECVLSCRFGHDWQYDVKIIGVKPKEEWTGEIIKFLDKSFSLYERRLNCNMMGDEESGGVSFRIDIGGNRDTENVFVKNFIDKLTKENYERFIVEEDSKKYNL